MEKINFIFSFVIADFFLIWWFHLTSDPGERSEIQWWSLYMSRKKKKIQFSVENDIWMFNVCITTLTHYSGKQNGWWFTWWFHNNHVNLIIVRILKSFSVRWMSFVSFKEFNEFFASKTDWNRFIFMFFFFLIWIFDLILKNCFFFFAKILGNFPENFSEKVSKNFFYILKMIAMFARNQQQTKQQKQTRIL